MTDPKFVRGPVYVEATPLLVTIDVTPLVSDNVHDLVALLADEFIDDFMELPEAGPLAFEELHAKLVERLATKVVMTGKQAVRVGDQVAKLGRERTVPEQRGEAA